MRSDGQVTREHSWIAQVLGDPESDSWEISVVKSGTFGTQSWGWFCEDKLLISHNGGPCHWPMAKGVGSLMVQVAERYAAMLNAGEQWPRLKVEGCDAK